MIKMNYEQEYDLLLWRAKLESLITERDAMIWENEFRKQTDQTIAYFEELFFELQDKINKLIEEIIRIG